MLDVGRKSAQEYAKKCGVSLDFGDIVGFYLSIELKDGVPNYRVSKEYINVFRRDFAKNLARVCNDAIKNATAKGVKNGF